MTSPFRRRLVGAGLSRRAGARGGSQALALALDQVDTTNLLAGCSAHRLLRSAYGGSAFRVREAGLSGEADIGFAGGVTDQAAIVSHCGANDGFIRTFYDQSGNGNDHINATAAQQPKIHDSATGVLLREGFVAMDFDGSDDTIDAGSALGMTGNPGLDMFFVIQSDSLAADNRFYQIGGSGAGTYVAGQLEVSGEKSAIYGDGNRFFTSVLDATAQLFLIHVRRASGDTYGDTLFWSNLTAMSESSSSNPTFAPTLSDTLASVRNTFNGGLVELIVFGVASGDALSATDATTLRNNITSYYGLV